MLSALAPNIDEIIADPKTYGARLCLANALAKMETRILFTEILARIHDIRLFGSAAWVEASFVSGLKRLPITHVSKAKS